MAVLPTDHTSDDHVPDNLITRKRHVTVVHCVYAIRTPSLKMAAQIHDKLKTGPTDNLTLAKKCDKK